MTNFAIILCCTIISINFVRNLQQRKKADIQKNKLDIRIYHLKGRVKFSMRGCISCLLYLLFEFIRAL